MRCKRKEREGDGERAQNQGLGLESCLELVGNSEKKRMGRRKRRRRGEGRCWHVYYELPVRCPGGDSQQEVGLLECFLFIRKDPKAVNTL